MLKNISLWNSGIKGPMLAKLVTEEKRAIMLTPNKKKNKENKTMLSN